MKRILAVALALTFVISMFVGVAYAQDLQDGSTTVDGWGSYTSHGSALVEVYPITYFNYEDELLVQVNVTNNVGPDEDFAGEVKVYHYGNGDPFDTLNMDPTDNSPVGFDTFTTGLLADGAEEIVFVRVAIEDVAGSGVPQDLWRGHSIFADADSQ